MKAVIVLIALLCSLSASAGSFLDPTFNSGTGTDSFVETVTPLDNGQIMICGNFTTYNGVSRPYIARLNEDGSLDESFNAHPAYWVRHMAVQADGKIVIGGFFTVVESTSRNLVARLNTDGTLDTTFNPGSGCTNAIAEAVDGNRDPCVFWVAIQPWDQKILLAGNFRNYNGASSIGIVRVNTDGSRDTNFNVGTGLDSWGRSILVQTNQQICVSGWMTSYNGHDFNRIVRMNSDGSPDLSFHPYFGDSTSIYTMGLRDDGKMIVAGHSVNTSGPFHSEIERLNADGTPDTSFTASTNEKTESLYIQPDGRIVAAGYFTLANGVSRKGIARWNPDGTLDPDFQASIDNFVWTVRPDAKGRILIAGGFYNVDGTTHNGIARFDPGASQPVLQTAPLIKSFSHGSGLFRLTFASESGRNYTLQSRDSVTQASWTDGASIHGTGGDIVLIDRGSPTGPLRYFRIKAE